MPLFAEIVLPLALPRTLTWELPFSLQDSVRPGCRVEVQLGKNKRYAGVVKKILPEVPEGIKPKSVLSLLDPQPVVDATQLRFWDWLAEYYACTDGEVLQAALPAHLKLSSDTVVQYNDMHQTDLSTLNDNEFLLAEALEIRGSLKLDEIQKILDIKTVYPIVKSLIEKGICHAFETLTKTYKPRVESFVVLNPQYEAEEELEKLINEWTKAPRQLDLLLALLHLRQTEGKVTRPSLLKKAAATSAALDGLVAKNILRIDKEEVDRLPLLPRLVNLDFELSAAQAKALEQLRTSCTQNAVTLLHGITGSGKTQLYMHMMAEEIEKGRQCLFLLPEIALTTQIIRKIRTHFGGHVSVYHSRFNPAERLELWQKARSGELQIVVGPRSALFLPFRNLGMIIVDEEHDSSYKQQDPAPRFHARDAAIYLASISGAKTVLGSATPSVESYYNGITGKYGLVKLMERYGGIQLPALELVDLKKLGEDKSRNLQISPALREAVTENLDAGRQIIMFQNRRGYTPYQVCKVCGWIPKCRFCNVNLTYHKSTQKLHCHYCGTSYPQYKTCEHCGSQDFQQKHFGTEQLEEALAELFPRHNVARMDTDSVRGKQGHEKLIQLFENSKVQILVGTQMVVKGLDFDHVGLVGIPDGDGILHYADFRVNERAFQLIEQVSGRSGRKGKPGRVIMQLRDFSHPVLPFLISHDYEAFFDTEIRNRKEFFYPPFSRVTVISCRHPHQRTAWLAMQNLCNLISLQYKDQLSGPAEPSINKIRNQFITECMLRMLPDRKKLELMKRYLRHCIIQMNALPEFKNARFIIDVDAVG